MGETEPIPRAPVLGMLLDVVAVRREQCVRVVARRPSARSDLDLLVGQGVLGIQHLAELLCPHAEPQFACDGPQGDDREHDEGDAHRDTHAFAAGEEHDGALPGQGDVEQEQDRHHRDGDARPHALVTPAI